MAALPDKFTAALLLRLRHEPLLIVLAIVLRPGCVTTLEKADDMACAVLWWLSHGWNWLLALPIVEDFFLSVNLRSFSENVRVST